MSELLELLSIAQKLTPELRFCQLLMNIWIIKRESKFDDKWLATPTIFDPYNYSDKGVIKLIEDYIDKYKDIEYKNLLSSVKDLIQTAKDNWVEFEDPEEPKIDWEAIREEPLAIENGKNTIIYKYKDQREWLPIYYKLYISEDWTDDKSIDFIPHEYIDIDKIKPWHTCYKEGMYLHDVQRDYNLDNKNK